ncbi:MAG: tetratricopeptide repeat protein, partial [Casimicrobiaceae bacterium]
ELAPGDAKALRSAASLARILGDVDRALDLVTRAAAVDPLSAATHRQAAMIHLMGGHFDAAEASFQLALDISPSSGLNHAFLAFARLLQGRTDEALAIAGQESHAVFRNLALSLVHHKLGNAAASDAALQALTAEFAWTAAYQIAEAHAFRGEVDTAFEWLETAYVQRDPGVVYTAWSPALKSLHGDPRWLPFLTRLGLADHAKLSP